MDQQMLKELAELQRYAGALGSMMSSATAAAPAGAHGVDASRRVGIDIDSQGRPSGVTVDTSWATAIRPDALGAAVMEAYQQAVTSHMDEWSKSLERAGLRYDMRDFDASSGPPGPATPNPFVSRPNPFVTPDSGTGRGLEEMTSELVRLLDGAHARANEPTATTAAPVADAAAGHVVVGLRGGQLATVTVDATWAADRSGSAIAAELNAVLAREQLRVVDVRDADGAQTDPLTAGADSLLSDVFRLLDDPTIGA